MFREDDFDIKKRFMIAIMKALKEDKYDIKRLNFE